MSRQLRKEAVENLSKLCKDGRGYVVNAIKRYGGDIIKKEVDSQGNIKYFYSDHGYLYYNVIYAEIAAEDTPGKGQ
jgi:hypothetical protein